MNFQLKHLLGLASVVSNVSMGTCSESGSAKLSIGEISINNTILQNLQALAMNQTLSDEKNSSLSYISLLLALNSSCTSNFTQMLNSSSGNMTFFAPSDEAFRKIPGFPDFGPNFCQSCDISGSGGGIGERLRGRIHSTQATCPVGCNSTATNLNATSAELMPCLPQILQYHLLNESLSFNNTSFGFLNRSEYNMTVLPTFLNSTCLVNLANTTGNVTEMQESSNNQVLVFNITNRSNSSSEIDVIQPGNFSSNFNVSILHGINMPANVTVFDIQSSNGILHVIDALLIPPANFTQTLNATYKNSTSTSSEIMSSSFNSTLPLFLNNTNLEMYANMSGITVFLPDPLTISNSTSNSTSSSGTGFNITNYIFNSLLYNNRTIESIGNLTSPSVFIQQNLTNLNGENVTILFGRDNSMIFNGTSRVTQSNILMKNGVLHLIDGSNLDLSPSVPSTENSTTISGGLGRILHQFI